MRTSNVDSIYCTMRDFGGDSKLISKTFYQAAFLISVANASDFWRRRGKHSVLLTVPLQMW